jgi:acetyltransferase-like isoleucine patch superfamily enzyme
MSNLSKKRLIQNRYKIKELIKLIRYVTCGHEKRSKILRSEGAIIGSNCKIYPSVSFGSEPYLIELGNDVRITAGVRITTHDGGIPVLVKS